MSSVEAARHALYSELERVLGSEHAKTLMNHLPQHPADEAATKADIARLEASTKADIARLEDRFDERFSRLEDRFDRLDERMDRMQRFYVGTTVGSMTALTAIFSLVAAFLT